MLPDADDAVVLGRFAWGVPMPMRAGFDRDLAGRRTAAQSEIS